MQSRQKRTVLIVDSSPIVLYCNAILMRRLHYSVLCATSPDDALWIMQRTVPDLILTGNTFAHENGIDFIGKIKRNFYTRDVPVIVLASARAGARGLIAGKGAVSYPCESRWLPPLYSGRSRV